MPLGSTPGSGATGTVQEESLRGLGTAEVVTSNGVGGPLTVGGDFRLLVFQLVVTSVGGGAADTLDVFVQQSFDGANWDDLIHFQQLTGASTEGVQLATVPLWRPDQPAEWHLRSDAALAAGTVRSVGLGRQFRAKWVVGGATPAFVFGLFVAPR